MGSLCNADGSKILFEDDSVEVTQADRDAAAALAAQFQRGTFVQVEAPAIRRGEHDEWELVRSFARHRQQAIAQHEGGQGEPFGYWIEQKGAEPALLRKPAYIPEPSDLRTVTPLYAHPPATHPAALVEDEVEALARVLAHADGLDWDETCALECPHQPGIDDCDSSTCIAALDEDHDPDAARNYYLKRGRAITAHLSPRLTQQAEEVARLRALVEHAFGEGYALGAIDAQHENCAFESDWNNSASRAALNEQPGGEG